MKLGINLGSIIERNYFHKIDDELYNLHNKKYMHLDIYMNDILVDIHGIIVDTISSRSFK
jgi:hypothetical protein